MYSYQGQLYASHQEVPETYLKAFTQQNPIAATLRVEANNLILWEAHYLRFMATMRILRMQIPLHFTMEYLQEKIHELLEAKSLANGSAIVQLSVVRAENPSREQPIPSSLFSITATEASPFEHRQQTLAIDLYKDHYLPKGLYSSLDAVHNTWYAMAWVYVHENDFCDGILLNPEKKVMETLRGSLFLVQGNIITTPALDQGCRKSVYRSELISVIQQAAEFELVESEISPFALQKADEMFVLDGVNGIISVPKYRKKSFSMDTATTITQLMQAKLTAAV